MDVNHLKHDCFEDPVLARRVMFKPSQLIDLMDTAPADWVSLEELEGLGRNSPKWKQFFEERGSSDHWQEIKRLNQSGEYYSYLSYQEPNTANELAGGIIRYLARYKSGDVTGLQIHSDNVNPLTELDPAIGKLTNLEYLYLNNN